MKTIKYANDAEQLIRLTVCASMHEQNISLKEISEECDIKESYIKSWLSHKKQLNLNAFLAITKCLKISIHIDSTNFKHIDS